MAKKLGTAGRTMKRSELRPAKAPSAKALLASAAREARRQEYRKARARRLEQNPPPPAYH